MQVEAKLEWSQARTLADEFSDAIKRDHPDLYREMEGIAQGSGNDVLDIVALNVRSEIGLATPVTPIDGCTSFGWRDSEGVQWSAQNWDWKASAARSLVMLDIRAYAPTKRPRIRMMTEAGVIGKIGTNDFGVSVMLNALKTTLRDPSYIPIHLLLRRFLEHDSVDSCLSYLSSDPILSRCASAAHVLVTDPTKSVSIETLPTGSHVREQGKVEVQRTSSETGQLQVETVDSGQWVGHTNHLLWTREATESLAWPDSVPRFSLLCQLVSDLVEAVNSDANRKVPEDDKEPGTPSSFELIRSRVLSDRSLGPKGICRDEAEEPDGSGGVVTVFSIVVRHGEAGSTGLGRRGKGVRTEVKIGRPDLDGEIIAFES
ncbi:hypothetical protein JCM10212_004543 [Sporobolomyces blumeae]